MSRRVLTRSTCTSCALSAAHGAALTTTCTSIWTATRTVRGWRGSGGLSPPGCPAHAAMMPPCAPPRRRPAMPAAAAGQCRQTCPRPSHLCPRRMHSPCPRRRQLMRCHSRAGPQLAPCCGARSAIGPAARLPLGTTSRCAVHELGRGLSFAGCRPLLDTLRNQEPNDAGKGRLQ